MVTRTTRPIENLVYDLQSRGVNIWVEEERLRTRAAKGAITPALRAEIQSRKPELLTFLRQAHNGAEQFPIQPVAHTGALPLSFAQQRLWFLEQMGSGYAYNMVLSLHLQGTLQITALQQALTEIVRRHASLRTTFITVDGTPQQVIQPPPEVALPIIDLQQLSPDAQADEVTRLTRAEAQQGIDLEQDLMIRTKLLGLKGPASESDSQDHLLLITMHHIAFDGWSLGVLLHELETLYTAFLEGNPPLLPELPLQYADFAVWQRQWLQGEVLGKQLDYWKKQLAEVPQLLQLPTDHPRPLRPSYQGNQIQFVIEADLTLALKQLSQQEGCTLFMTLLGAFQVLLYRYTQQESFVIGTIIANRQHRELESLIGFFANTLALRADLSTPDGEPLTFRDLLARVRQTTQHAYDHQDLPFERLVEELQVERTLSHNPLVQVAFALQNTPLDVLELPGLVASRLEFSDIQSSRFDLEFHLFEGDDQLECTFIYRTDLFDEATIARMADHFAVLLDSIVSHPDQPVLQLPMLTNAEYHQIVYEWNECAASRGTVRDTAVDFGEPQTIHALFEQQVERTPEAMALVYPPSNVILNFVKELGEQGGAQLTYAELNARANQLAHHLISLGVQPDTLVAVAMERSIEMVVGLLAVLKAGGAYVPIDPTYPTERIRYMLTDCAAPILLTQSHLSQRAPWGTEHVVIVDRVGAQLPTHNPESRALPEHIAVVIYTSGSTGQPKGVMIEHQALAGHIVNVSSIYGIMSQDRVLQFSAFSFDAAQEQIFTALCNGAAAVLRGNDVWTAEKFSQQVVTQGITIADLPPAYFQQLLTVWAQERPVFLEQHPLRLILLGGEKVQPEIVRSFRQLRIPSTRLLNVYGPTEATVTASLFDLTDYQPKNMPTNLPIGKPLLGRKAYILDDHGLPVPVGVFGELYIGGDSLAQGYLNRPKLTAERFIEHPEFGRLYKTGDLCRWLLDGNIEFMGRTDFQVKIRGFRIELGEIEAHLHQCVGVREAVVVVIDGKRLVAYVTFDDDMVGEVKDLRAQLTHSLPNYMIPSAFVLLDALPLTPNGKVDRKALSARPVSGTSEWLEHADFVEPRTATEAGLVDIWLQLLQLERVSIHDNFFTVGGDSILSLQVVSRARQRGISITPRQIFQYQTIAELADAVQPRPTQSFNCAQSAQVASIVPPWTLDAQALVTGEVPLTPIQHGWAALNLPNPHIYNQSILIEIDTLADSALLQQALQILLRHHDALRLRYQESTAGWRQNFSPPTDDVLFFEVDVTELSESAVKETVVLITNKIECSLNLTNGPMMGLALLRHTDGPSHLLWMIHHLVVDWVSWRILLADLETIYQQLAHGEPVQLAAKTSSFQQWARWLHDRGPTVFAHELDYWVSRFERVQPLPQDKPHGVPTWASVRAVSAELTVEETQALLQQAPAAYATQINDLLLTALLQTMVEWTQEAVMLIELESHGRQPIANSKFDDDSEIDLSRTVGWFTSAFPVRLDYQPGDLGDLILSVKEQLRQVPNHGLGYGILRYIQQSPELMPFPMPLILPLSGQVCFNYLGQFNPPAPNPAYNHPNGAQALLRGTGMEGFASSDTFQSLSQQRKDESLSEFFKQNGSGQFWNLFDLELMVVTGQLRVIWLYSENVHDRDTVERLTQGFMTNLRHLITHCQQQARLQQAVYA